jgi:hypothetical protein
MQVLTVFLTFIGVVRDIPLLILNWLTQMTATLAPALMPIGSMALGGAIALAGLLALRKLVKL